MPALFSRGFDRPLNGGSLTLGLMGLDELHLRVLASSSDDPKEKENAKLAAMNEGSATGSQAADALQEDVTGYAEEQGFTVK